MIYCYNTTHNLIMEGSSLRFLDYHVAKMVAYQVRVSQEEEARKFHSGNYDNYHEIDLNHDNHYFISMIFEEIGYLLDYPVIPKRKIYVIKGYFFRDTKAEINILDFKRCYDFSVQSHIKNTRLQRCGYNY